MAEIWIIRSEGCELTGWSKRRFNKTAAGEKWAWRNSNLTRKNGKPEREYALNALPAEAQLKYAAGAGREAAIVKTNKVLPLFAAAPESEPVCAIAEDLKDLAHQRLEALGPLLDFRRRMNGHRPEIALPGGRSVSTLNALAEWVAAQQKPLISTRTLFRWLERFDKGGVAALGKTPRKDKGMSRYFDEHPAAAAYLQRKYLEEGLSMRMCWEALCRDWKRTGSCGEPPSYSTVATFLGATPAPIRVLAREGKEAHEKKCSPFIQRGPVPAMEWWISDHRVFDVMVRNTLFPTMKPDQAYRLWLTAVWDWGSQKIIGWCFAPTPSSRTINSALRMGVLAHGFPQNFYWDNGEDFKKVRRDLEPIVLSEEADALLARERAAIGITSALPKHPRSKPIEARFTRFARRFDVIWRPAYLGNKPGNCPQSGRQAQALHQKYLKGQRADSPLPTDAEFILAAAQWIEEHNETPIGKLHHRTPNEVMNEQHPECSRIPVNPRLLDVLFSERTDRVVQAGGCVQLDGMRYEPEDASLFALDLRKGQTVKILRDPYNLGEAVAVDPETLRYVGELRIQELVAQCPGGRITRDQIKAAMRRERSLRRGYAEYLGALSAMAANAGWMTEREALLERAGARTGTDGPRRAAVPGEFRKQLPAARERRALQPAFVSDAVAEDAGYWRDRAKDLGD